MGSGLTRNMHYLPQCYLKGFAKAPSKKSQLHVYDLKQGRWFPTIPRNVGARRDFNAVQVEGLAPDEVESWLSRFEAKFDALLTLMRETFAMPTGEEYENLMALIALIAVRNPLARENHNKFLIEVAEQIADLTLASKERYESVVQQIKDEGRSPGPEIPYEDMVKFREGGQYKIKVGNTMNVFSEMKVFPEIAALLGQRHWSLVIAGKEAGHFVCCDHPVSLTWSSTELQKGFRPPGYGLTSTEVAFPVTKELALVGTFEGDDRVVTGNAEMVALINSRIVSYCDWQIYSPRPEFSFLGGDREIYRSDQLKDFLRRASKK